MNKGPGSPLSLICISGVPVLIYGFLPLYACLCWRYWSTLLKSFFGGIFHQHIILWPLMVSQMPPLPSCQGWFLGFSFFLSILYPCERVPSKEFRYHQQADDSVTYPLATMYTHNTDFIHMYRVWLHMCTYMYMYICINVYMCINTYNLHQYSRHVSLDVLMRCLNFTLLSLHFLWHPMSWRWLCTSSHQRWKLKHHTWPLSCIHPSYFTSQ